MPVGADGITGTASRYGTDGYRPNLGGFGGNPSTTLFDFKLSDGADLQVYCVQITENLNTSAGAMVEVPWTNYPDASSQFVANSAKINWLLHHSYPVTSLSTLQSVLAAKGVTIHSGLSTREAVTATQVAAWHFSDGANLDKVNPLMDSSDSGTESDVLALYNYLIGPDNVGLGQPQTPSLKLSPTNAVGKTGDRLGPFVVSTNGDVTGLAATVPTGVKITDKDGVQLTAGAVEDDTELYFDLTAATVAGSGSVKLTASAVMPTGRLFVGKDGRKMQSLIVAKSTSTTLTATATASWTVPVVPPTSSTTTPPVTTTTTTEPPTTTTEPTETTVETTTPTETTETTVETTTETPTPTETTETTVETTTETTVETTTETPTPTETRESTTETPTPTETLETTTEPTDTTTTEPTTTDTTTTDTTTTTTTPPVTTTTTTVPAPQARAGGLAGLAATGASVLIPIGVGLALLGAGLGTLLLMRRRGA